MRVLLKLCLFLAVSLSFSAAYAEKNKITNHHKKTHVIESKYKGSTKTKISINQATAKELALLKGIGKKSAQNIVAYRQKNGEFKKIDDLSSVHGFSQAKIEKIIKENKDKITL